MEINLLPPEIKLKKARTHQYIGLFTISLIIVIITILLVAVGYSLRLTLGIQLQSAQKEIDSKKEELATYKDIQEYALVINEKVKSIKDLSDSRIKWTQVLSEFNKTIPSDVQISSFSGAQGSSFSISGYTTSRRQVEVFKESLESSPYFADVEYNSTNVTKEGDQEKVSFNFAFNLTWPSNQEIK